VERTRLLAFLVPLDAPNPQLVYEGLRNEIRLYSDALYRKPHIVVLSKRDLLPAGDPLPRLELDDARGMIAVSSAAGTGLEELKEYLWKAVGEVRAEEEATRGSDELGVEEEWET
jgi:GTP-binding protein